MCLNLCTSSLIVIFVLAFSSATMADTQKPITLDAGDMELFAEGGAAKLNHDWTWIADAGFKAGLLKWLEVAAPAALSVSFLNDTPVAVSITLGITDLWPAGNQHFLFTPALVVSARSRLSHEALALFSLDYTHAQYNRNKSPGFLRGSGALMVDMGPYLTWCIGISYQRLAVDRPSPPNLSRSGFAGRHRISLGSVRVTPFNDVPLFSIHLGRHLDMTLSARFDIDADTDTSDTRLEGGVLIFW
ncbi:MAG: hypothetical protein JXR76_14860 [Deltaproteobacteria bacterium]|nr:hypothetical protein [Deltaproteobacteria bacterium]